MGRLTDHLWSSGLKQLIEDMKASFTGVLTDDPRLRTHHNSINDLSIIHRGSDWRPSTENTSQQHQRPVNRSPGFWVMTIDWEHITRPVNRSPGFWLTTFKIYFWSWRAVHKLETVNHFNSSTDYPYHWNLVCGCCTGLWKLRICWVCKLVHYRTCI